ncbi:MAG: LysM peptidoglycan-binding domain-containing protein, partial [Saprospiraceae bacterium]|nr:LysM peptidoglycan-binding domain-containing protein [Saprospiraceae bacterium]
VENPSAAPTVTAKSPVNTPPPTVKKVTPTAPVSAPPPTTAKPLETVASKPAEETKAPVVVAKPTETVVAKPVITEPAVQEVFSEQAVIAAPATKSVVTPSTTTVPAVATPKPETVREPSYIQEYLVRDGDTIDTVSKKFGITPKELSDINNTKSDEALVTGTRLMIPRY